MKSKRLYLLIIFYIAVFSVLFNWQYPETSVSNVVTVISILGLIAAIGTNYIIKMIANSLEGKNE
ncbi:MAG: hypothetical protein ACN4GM_08985 [Gammaproteobacteria bacterium]